MATFRATCHKQTFSRRCATFRDVPRKLSRRFVTHHDDVSRHAANVFTTFRDLPRTFSRRCRCGRKFDDVSRHHCPLSTMPTNPNPKPNPYEIPVEVPPDDITGGKTVINVKLHNAYRCATRFICVPRKFSRRSTTSCDVPWRFVTCREFFTNTFHDVSRPAAKVARRFATYDDISKVTRRFATCLLNLNCQLGVLRGVYVYRDDVPCQTSLNKQMNGSTGIVPACWFETTVTQQCSSVTATISSTFG